MYTRAIPSYLRVAAAIALSRVILYLWLVHRYSTHTVTETVLRLGQLVYPEEFVAIHTGIASIESRTLFLSLFIVMLTLGSLILASPLLMVGAWKRGAK